MPTVKDMLERFKKERLPHLKATTKENYTKHCDVLRRHFGRKNVRALKRADLDAFLDVPTGKINRERSITVLSSAMSAAVKWKWIDVNPCLHIERHKTKLPIRQVSEEDYVALKGLALKAYGAPLAARVSLVMDLVRNTGRSQNDILELRWAQVDESAGTILFRHPQPKAIKAKILVPITPAVKALLGQAERISNGRKDFVIVTKSGEPYSKFGFRTTYQRLLSKWDKTGRDRITFHDIARLGRKLKTAIQTSDPTERFPLGIHDEIDRAARKLFHDGHYANAVEAACKVLDLLVKMRSGKDDVSGTPLMQVVFSPNNPILRFNDLRSQSDRDEQQGMMFLYAGAMLALRNRRAHELIEDDPEQAVSYIGFLSMLAKALNRTKR
jgi:uncharacterized protein (TIGR02391 family)